MEMKDPDLISATLSGARIDRLGKDLIIIENPSVNGMADFPFRSGTTVSIVTLEGSFACVIDMEIHSISVKGMLVILPSQTVEKVSFGEDFRGYCLIMSSTFLDNLPMGNKIPLISSVRQHGFYPLDGKQTEALTTYFRMVQATLRVPNNYQHEILTHLTAAYYYGLGTYIHDTGVRPASRYAEISNEFLELVRDNCHLHRDMEFYAGALCLSAKHVNLAVKSVTGDNAMKWIERYTILKAKSLLRTTALTVGDIAERLNFPSSSDFGKYFRKFTGKSPRSFREG